MFEGIAESVNVSFHVPCCERVSCTILKSLSMCNFPVVG